MSNERQFEITPESDPRFPGITPAVSVDDGDGAYSLPRRFRASTALNGLLVELHVELDEAAKPTCRALAIRPAAEAEDLGSGALRAVPLQGLLREATVAAAQKVEPAGERAYMRERGTGEVHRFHPPDGPGSQLDTLRPTTAPERQAFYEQLAGGKGPGRGARVTDAHLGRVAAIYRAAVEHGDPPTQAVADAMYAARSTAGRWVVEARKRGFLGPASPGRAGEKGEGES